MKKITRFALALMLTTAVTTVFTNCGGGDDAPAPKQIDNNNSNSGSDDNNNGGGDTNTGDVKQLILGSWKCTHNSTDYTVISFNQDGTSKWVYRCEDDIDRWILPYEITSSQLIFTEEGKKIQYTYSLSGNRLIFDSDEYLKIENYVDEDDPDNNSGDTQTTPDTDYANRGAVAKQFRGSGSSSDPYIISDATELRKLADDVESGKTYRDEYFKMTADVIINRNVLNANGDLNGSGASFEQWKPIGKGSTPFCGTFDGNGHTISGIYINKEQRDSLGLFGFSNGVIQNLSLKDSYIIGYSCCGGIVGYAGSKMGKYDAYSAQIYDCFNYATVRNSCSSPTTGYVGGITGYFYVGTIKRCANYGTINSYYYGGGISGYSKGTIHSSVNKGSVSGLKNKNNVGHVGGITGYSNSGLRNCINFGVISGNRKVGGIVGQLSNGVLYCVNIGTTQSDAGESGAIVYNISARYATIKNCYYLDISGNAPTKSYQSLTIENCISMTSKQMKDQSFLDELNKNASSPYSQWKFGKDGYPILEWINE